MTLLISILACAPTISALQPRLYWLLRKDTRPLKEPAANGGKSAAETKAIGGTTAVANGTTNGTTNGNGTRGHVVDDKVLVTEL